MNKHATPHYDVIILGAGCVGLSLALALAQHGLAVAVIEKGVMPTVQPSTCLDPWVSALNRRSEVLLQRVGVWASLGEQEVCAMTDMQVWDDQSDGYFSFACTDLAEPDLGHIVSNQGILAVLWQRAQALSQISVFTESTVIEYEMDGLQATVMLSGGQTLSCELMVGAEGGQSLFRRKQLGAIKTIPYRQQAIVALVEHERHHAYTARQRFCRSGPIALLPLSGGHHSALIWSQDDAEAQRWLHETQTCFNQALERQYSDILGAMTLKGERLHFPLQGQHATQYGGRHWVLVGDAAHRIHPLAGQGLNLGLQDVCVLAGIIGDAKEAGRCLGGERVIAEYSRQRRFGNELMLQSVSQLKRLFGMTHSTICWGRGLGMQYLQRSPLLKRAFSRYALGL